MEQAGFESFWTTRRLFGLVISTILILALAGAWFIYNMIFGLGGWYTAQRYIPTPKNLTEDVTIPPGAIDAHAPPGHWRMYEVEQTLEEIVAFNRQALPEMGWTIVTQGAGSSLDPPSYCIIAQQRNVSAHIYMTQTTDPSFVHVYISINEPDSSCTHLLN